MILNLSENIKTISGENIQDYQISILKVTALWAFSESAFGGILHALAIPFRGLFINSAAVLFISLIALFAKSNREILKSTLIILLIKGLVSPHTPIAAYFAVSLQGLFGYLFFFQKKYFRLSALLLGTATLFLTGLQRIILLTVIFGNTLWKSINLFIKQIAVEIFQVSPSVDINYGLMLIGVYVAIHIVAGFFIGYYAGLLPKKINHYSQQISKELLIEAKAEIPTKGNRKKKNWLLRPTGIIIVFISLSILIYSYISPSSSEIESSEIITMLIRSITIIIVWFVLLGPIVKKLFQKYLAGKKSLYANEIDKILNMFPQFKKVISYCWKNSSDKKGLKRIHYFLSTTFYYLLLK